MTQPASDPASRAASDDRKQAVVLVHGMGEQVPMETLRGFVETMWVDGDVVARRDGDPPRRNPVWWKPDIRTGSLELSRITTRAAGAKNVRTDFYEFYWADLTDANTLIQLKDWFMSLLLRSPRQVPPEVVWVWLLLWSLTLGFGSLLLWRAAVTAHIIECDMPTWAKWTLGAGIAVYTVVIGFVLSYFGDVARYVRAKPPNIAARREIRNRGLELLRTLRDSGQYERIVLVAHSLGTIVAYDVLRSFWAESSAEREMQKGDPLYKAFGALEFAARDLPEQPSVAQLHAYRAKQADVFDAMQAGRAPAARWLISDFVTLGSPLSHAQFLMARDDAALQKAIVERRYPSSPPQFDDGRFVYRPLPVTMPWSYAAHHGAPFSAVRWTNIYDPAGEMLFLRGDIISGSVTRNFGRAIAEFPVEIHRRTGILPRRFFTHTEYWSGTKRDEPHLVVLRKALDLAAP